MRAHSWPRWAKLDEHDWDNAWIDGGPSPAGNAGPYLHLPYPPDQTSHRIYPTLAEGDTLPNGGTVRRVLPYQHGRAWCWWRGGPSGFRR